MLGAKSKRGPLERGSSGHRSMCVDVELSLPAESIESPGGYEAVLALVRLHGEPLGTVRLPLTAGRCRAVDVRRVALKELGWAVIRHLMEDRIASGMPEEGWSVRDLTRVRHPVARGDLPSVSVVVCTRDRPEAMAVCLEAVMRLDLVPIEIIVVDNAPSTDATERLVRERFGAVRYVQEPRPGLDWARNRGIAEANGEIVAFTDDDCVVDPGWLRAIATLFASERGAMAMTGLVVAHELETEAQHLFERSGGFGRGFRRRWHAVDRERGLPWEYCGAGQFGTGANMAFRRSLFSQIGLFDPALDVGTVTLGGGDLDIFFRVLIEGHSLVYDPAAVVRHRHRSSYPELTRQMAGNGYGFSSFLVANAMAYRHETMRFFYLASWWLWRWQLVRWFGAVVRPSRLPRQLLAVELWTGLTGLFRYPRARRNARKIADRFGSASADPGRPVTRWIRRRRGQAWVGPMGVRTIDIQQTITGLTDVSEYELVKLFVIWGDRLIGSVVVPNQHRPLSARRIRESIAEALSLRLLEYTREGALGSPWNAAEAAIFESFGAAEPPVLQERLSSSVPVSIVVATLDRPSGLRECLRGIQAQRTSRRVEVIVVDNNPRSGVAASVVAEFPGVRLLAETRRGLSFARNTGILASTGEIVIATDDDVVIPPQWLERLVAPFARPDVMVVTGNVLPAELETDAQLHFETYGGLGRGFMRFEVDGDWFESFRLNATPTWELGATANAAFRTSLFSEPGVGLMDVALGAGTPTGCSEDSYAIYRALKAHHTLVYEPTAYLWHHHRATMKSLRKQIYSYSKGHVAYHLTTLFRDHDLRALKRLLVDLPVWRVTQVWSRSRHRTTYPLSLVAIEIWGNLVGPVALMRSRVRARFAGRGEPVAALVPPPLAVPTASRVIAESETTAAAS